VFPAGPNSSVLFHAFRFFFTLFHACRGTVKAHRQHQSWNAWQSPNRTLSVGLSDFKVGQCLLTHGDQLDAKKLWLHNLFMPFVNVADEPQEHLQIREAGYLTNCTLLGSSPAFDGFAQALYLEGTLPHLSVSCRVGVFQIAGVVPVLSHLFEYEIRSGLFLPVVCITVHTFFLLANGFGCDNHVDLGLLWKGLDRRANVCNVFPMQRGSGQLLALTLAHFPLPN
jgi:hypothetical protein